jgi:hypothetical protein
MTDSLSYMLRQRDLSPLRVQEMKPEERAELMRRYGDFVDHFRIGEEPEKPRNMRKWIPGETAPTE